MKTYSSGDVSRITHVTPRELQWWVSQNLIRSGFNGRKRTYSHSAVIRVAIIADLRRKGFSLDKVRHVLRLMTPQVWSRINGTVPAELYDLHLLTDGRTVHIEPTERIIELLKQAKQPMSLVCFSDHLRRMESA